MPVIQQWLVFLEGNNPHEPHDPPLAPRVDLMGPVGWFSLLQDNNDYDNSGYDNDSRDHDKHDSNGHVKSRSGFATSIELKMRMFSICLNVKFIGERSLIENVLRRRYIETDLAKA